MSEPIIFVTGNEKKLKEFVDILGTSFPRQIVSKIVDLPELQGDIEYIAIKKCKEAARIVQGPVIIEDSSLCFLALKGLPGPYIKWFQDKLGSAGLVRMLAGWDDKSAEAVCTFAYAAGPDDDVLFFQGKTLGNIVEPRGTQGFGWDTCFEPIGFKQTYGEMDKTLKNTISHGYRALEKLRAHFDEEKRANQNSI